MRNMLLIVYHADWGTDPKKRWLCKAGLVGDTYRAAGAAVVGFDFPIGIPFRYAALLGVTDFKPFLLELGHGTLSGFYNISIQPTTISKQRPFYPQRPGGTRHAHLMSALGLTGMNQLRRRCELRYEGRKTACPLFWTLGANQVGRAAIIGWRDVIVPALRTETSVVL